MRFLKSFQHALNGLKAGFLKEKNFRTQCFIACFAVAAGFIFCITPLQWIALLFCITLVLSLEMINSAIEKMADFMHPDFHPSIKRIKDLAAGAVLLSSIISFIIGCIIFFPKVISLFLN